jgi:hypothetical protein
MCKHDAVPDGGWVLQGWRQVRRARLWLTLLLAFGGLAVSIRDGHAAEPLPAPRSEVLLTVSGAIGRGNAQDSAGRLEARFDRAMLEQMGITEVNTATPWHSGAMRFEGVLLRAVLGMVEARGDNLLAIAYNEYSATLPASDAARYNVILAMKLNGEIMTLRDKGPLFIIYPFDNEKALQTDMTYIRSVWQLRRIDVR